MGAIKESGNHVEVLDSLRAFAAISVCLFHFVCTTTDYIYTIWIREVFNVGQFGVQLFFVISGFVIPFSMHKASYQVTNFFKFLSKRLIRLEPPYLFSIILAIFLLVLRENWLSKSNTHIDISTKQIALHFGYLIPFFSEYKWLNPVYWTLAIEFQYYLLMAVLFIPMLKANAITVSVAVIAALIVAQFSPAILVFYWFPFFILGILIFLYKEGKLDKLYYFVLTGIVILYCAFNFPVMVILYVLMPIVLLIGYQHVKIPLLNYLGTFSYSIYLIHPLIGASFVNYFSHIYRGPLEKVIVIVGGLFVTLIGSWLTFQFIEKPSKKLSASLKY